MLQPRKPQQISDEIKNLPFFSFVLLFKKFENQIALKIELQLIHKLNHEAK
jgi:hypothetical protein